MKAGSVLALGVFQSMLDRSKSPEESCWNTSILQRISALPGFREGLFILPKNDDSDTWGQHEAKIAWDKNAFTCRQTSATLRQFEKKRISDWSKRQSNYMLLQSMKKVRSWHLNMMQKTLLCTVVFKLIVYVNSSHSVPWVQFFSANPFVFFTQFKVEEIS